MPDQRQRWFYLSASAASSISGRAHHLTLKRTKTACGMKLPDIYARWWKTPAEMKPDRCPDCLLALKRRKKSSA